MKKLLTLALLSLSISAMSTITVEPTSTFTVQGKFISEHSVNYEVYVINSDSTLELVTSDCALKFFTIDIEIGKEYLVKFISRDNKVKYLTIDASEYGGFGVDVDFERSGSARLSYNPYKNQYSIVPLETSEISYVYHEGKGNNH